jgi:hypothetical protein
MIRLQVQEACTIVRLVTCDHSPSQLSSCLIERRITNMGYVCISGCPTCFDRLGSPDSELSLRLRLTDRPGLVVKNSSWITVTAGGVL